MRHIMVIDTDSGPRGSSRPRSFSVTVRAEVGIHQDALVGGITRSRRILRKCGLGAPSHSCRPHPIPHEPITVGADPMSRKDTMRKIILVAGLAAAAFGLTACATGNPANSISQSGTYVAGEDIVPGTWKISRGIGTVDKPCEWHVWHGDNLVLQLPRPPPPKRHRNSRGIRTHHKPLWGVVPHHAGAGSRARCRLEFNRRELLVALVRPQQRQ